MSLKIIVLAKQVPDTRNVGKDAMKEDGTINRAALPAIFNPEDLNALEQALRLKDAYPGTTVTLLTMGPGRAAEIIREGLYRGADGGYLLTDRAFAGADTLATSYALATAIKKIGDYDIIIGGRQAIDGDTAQVGPQVAEKLGLTQVTYAEEILNVDEKNRSITVKRHIDGGVETVEGPLPIVITVNGSAAPCRPILFISALTKQRILKVLETAKDVYENRQRRVPTAKLNEIMLPITENYPPPAWKGKYIKIKYITQLPAGQVPSFVFFCNLPQWIKEPYKRFLENKIRENWNFTGTPINVFIREK